MTNTTCEICGKTFKNQNGLRLHSRVHSASADKEPRVSPNSFHPVRVVLHDAAGRLVVSYPVRTEEELRSAELNAEQRGYKMTIESS